MGHLEEQHTSQESFSDKVNRNIEELGTIPPSVITSSILIEKNHNSALAAVGTDMWLFYKYVTENLPNIHFAASAIKHDILGLRETTLPTQAYILRSVIRAQITFYENVVDSGAPLARIEMTGMGPGPKRVEDLKQEIEFLKGKLTELTETDV